MCGVANLIFFFFFFKDEEKGKGKGVGFSLLRFHVESRANVKCRPTSIYNHKKICVISAVEFTTSIYTPRSCSNGTLAKRRHLRRKIASDEKKIRKNSVPC